jgi:hypothetical protein
MNDFRLGQEGVGPAIGGGLTTILKFNTVPKYEAFHIESILLGLKCGWEITQSK